MNKIRVIDLLNKIAKGEEVPIIKYENHIYKFDKEEMWFNDIERNDWIKSKLDFAELNDEVEIIEEKDIEELDIQTNNGGAVCLRNEAGTLCGMNKHSIVMAKKINELIKTVNELKKEVNK